MTRKPAAFSLSPDDDAAPQGRAKNTSASSGRKKASPSATKPSPKASPRKKPARQTANPRRPQALPVKDIVLEPADFAALSPAPMRADTTPQRLNKTIKWGGLFFSALTGLVSLWASVAFYNMIEDLFARSPLLGWLATGLTGIAIFAGLAVILRELIGIFSLRKISKIHKDAERAVSADDAAAADRVMKTLLRLYEERAELSWGLAEINQTDQEFITAKDKITLLEQNLMPGLDERAGQIIASTARRVTVLTAVAPTAILDMVFVAMQNLKMLRQLVQVYGGRPGTFGTIKLAGMVVSHLAIAGGLALSDNLVQQFVGRGLLGKLSARFGEGAFNGILTARIGLAALDLARPLPFAAKPRPALADFLKNIIPLGSKSDR